MRRGLFWCEEEEEEEKDGVEEEGRKHRGRSESHFFFDFFDFFPSGGTFDDQRYTSLHYASS